MHWHRHAVQGTHSRTANKHLPGPLQDSAEAGTKEEVASLLAQLLRQKAGLLETHFGMQIDAGAVRQLPRTLALVFLRASPCCSALIAA
jgi:hypothetical protein